MEREEAFFLTVLADHASRRTTAAVDGLDWQVLADIAKRHQLTAILYAQCGEFMPPAIEASLCGDYAATIAFAVNRQQTIDELDRSFAARGIAFVIVKGVAVAECYPEPDLRTMSDLDMIVRPRDQVTAHEILLGLGFSCDRQGEQDWAYSREGLEIELHCHLLYENSLNTAEALAFGEGLWDHVQPVGGVGRCRLDPSFHFIFLLLHLRKHLTGKGVGFRQFFDLAMTAQTWSLDQAQVKAWLEEIGTWDFAAVCMTLCERWFQVSLPFTSAELSPEFAAKATAGIFKNGVFGVESEVDNYLIARILEQQRASFGTRIRRMFNLLLSNTDRSKPLTFALVLSGFFPSYRSLCADQRFAFVNHRPWLVPLAWIYRLPALAFIYTRRRLSVRSASVKTRESTLRQWGL